MRFFFAMMVLVLATVCTPFATAHLPYFRGYAAPVSLPGGDSGLLRRLHGDGIVLSDPIRPVVTDKTGAVRALGPVGYAVEQACSGGSCRVYVYGGTSFLPDVYRFDPLATKSSDVLSIAGGGDALDPVIRAQDMYGFVPEPDLTTRLAGAVACLMQWWPSFLILFAIGMSVVPVWTFLAMAIGPKEQNRFGSAMLALLSAGAITLPAAGLYALFLFATAYPPLLSLVAVSIPTLALVLARLVVRNGEPGAAAAV